MIEKLGVVILWCFMQSCSAEIYTVEISSMFYLDEFEDLPAAFGGKLSDGVVRGMLVSADPSDGCIDIRPPPDIFNEAGKWVVIISRFSALRNCTFEQKIRKAQLAGYDAAIVFNVHSNHLERMSAKNSTGIFIPSVFVGESSGLLLQQVYANTQKYLILITEESPFNIQTHLLIPFAIVVGICFIVMVVFMIVKCVRDRRRQRRHRLPTSTLNKIPTCKFQKGDPYDTCAICLDDYVEGEKLRVLPCNHAYHTKCIDPWLTKNRRVCPICKRKVFAHDERHDDSDSDSDTDDTTPLINSNNRGTQGGTFTQTQNPLLQRPVRSISQQSGANTNLVTASDHHSINGDYESSSTTTTSDDDYDECVLESSTRSQQHCDSSNEVEVQTHPTNTNSPSDGDVRV